MFYPDTDVAAVTAARPWKCPTCGHLPHFDAIVGVPMDERAARTWRDNVLDQSAEICTIVSRRERIVVKESECAPGRGRCEACGQLFGDYHAIGCASLDGVE